MAHGVPVLSLGTLAPFGGSGGPTQCLWTVDRSEEFPHAEAAVDLLCGGEVSLGRSISLQRQRRLSAELADGRQAIFAEGVVDVLVAAGWSSCPRTRWSGRGARSGALMLPGVSQSRTTARLPRPPSALTAETTRGVSRTRSPSRDAGRRGAEEGGVLCFHQEGRRAGSCAGREQ